VPPSVALSAPSVSLVAVLSTRTASVPPAPWVKGPPMKCEAPTGVPGSVMVSRPLLAKLLLKPVRATAPSTVPLLITTLSNAQPQVTMLKPLAPARTVPSLVNVLRLPSDTPAPSAPTWTRPLLVMVLRSSTSIPPAKAPPMIEPPLVMMLRSPAKMPVAGGPNCVSPTWMVPKFSMVLRFPAMMPKAPKPAESPTTILAPAALVTVLRLPTVMAKPAIPRRIEPLLVTALRSPSSMPRVKSPPVSVPLLDTVLRSPPTMPPAGKQKQPEPNWIEPRLITLLFSPMKMPKAGALTALPTVMVPVVALVIVLRLPAKMPNMSSPPSSVPLMLTALRLFTPMMTGPLVFCTVTPVSTLTVS
jgi:hypothetical protein